MRELPLDPQENPSLQPNEHQSDLSDLPSETYIVGTFRDAREKEQRLEHLDELGELVRSYGGEVLGKMLAPLKKANPGTYLGKGKIQELALIVETTGVKLVVFDCELSPGQQRNLEELLKVAVADRAEVILGVFARHARTRESRLQIELAEIQHHMPRLKRLWTHLSRQRGGTANQKGEGETQIEIDRRILKKRLEVIKGQIAEVQQTRDIKLLSRERSQIPSFAIVGYTNAGKSTLMNSLTNAEVFVEDKLFATLDTTTRKYRLPSGSEILLIDTVGFIRKLPHLLVAAFRSTLQEATAADLLLHLIDASNPCVNEHISATEVVLKELNALTKERLLVFNKIDQASPSQIMALRLSYPGACYISAVSGAGLEELALRMQTMLSARRLVVELKIPQQRADLLNQIYVVGKVLELEYVENDIMVKAELPPHEAARLAPYQAICFTNSDL